MTTQLLDALGRLSLEVVLLVGLAWLVTLSLRRAPAQSRHVVWLVVVLRLVVPIPLQLPTGLAGSWDRLELPVRQQPIAPVIQAAPERSETALPEVGSAAAQSPLLVADRAPEPVAVRAAADLPTSFPVVEDAPLPVGQLLGLGWAIGTALLAAAWLGRAVGLHRSLRGCRPVEREEVIRLFADLRRRLALGETIPLVVAPAHCAISLPAVWGVVRPRVVIPETLARDWSPCRLEPILVHELVHVKRLDHLVNTVLGLIQLPYFFHPAVWLVAWRLRVERELATDEAAVRFLGGNPLPYLRSLLDCVEAQIEPRRPLPAVVGLAEQAGQVEQRVRRLLSFGAGPGARARRLVTATAAAAGVVCLALSVHSPRVLELRGQAVLEGGEGEVTATVWHEGAMLVADPSGLRQPMTTIRVPAGERFELKVADEFLPVRVELSAPGHVAVAYRVVVPEQAALPVAWLRRGRPLEVAVVEGSTPAAEALVHGELTVNPAAEPYVGHWRPVLATGTTDERGRHRVVAPEAAATVEVEAVAASGRWGRWSGAVTGVDRVRVELSSSLLALRVVDERGEPVADAVVASAGAPLGTAVVTGDDGRAVLQVAGQPAVELTALAGDRLGRWRGERGEGPVELAVQPARSIELRWPEALDPVVLEPDWLPSALAVTPAVGRSGRASLPIVAPGGRLLAWGPGVAAVSVAVAAEALAVDLDLEAAARVTGAVVRADASAVAGAPVWTHVPAWYLTTGLGQMVSAEPFEVPLERAWLPWAVSGADGSFAVTALPRSRLELETRMTGFAPAFSGGLDARAGAALAARLVLAGGETLRLEVVDEQGAAVAGASVVLGRRGAMTKPGPFVASGEMEPLATARSGVDGMVVLGPAPHGAVEVRVSAPGFVVRMLSELSVPAGGLDLGRVALARAAVLAGRTVDRAGRPVPAARVAWSRNPQMRGRNMAAPETVTSGDDGRFVVDGLEPSGDVYLSATAAGLVADEPLAVTLPIDGPVEVRLLPERTVTGVVVDGDGRPVAEAEVSLGVSRTLGGPRAAGSSQQRIGHVMTDERGRFRLGGAGPGRHELTAAKADLRDTVVEVDVVAEEDPAPVELVLEEGLEIRVHVLDPNGAPAAAVAVGARSLASMNRRIAGWHGRAVTDDEGGATVSGLAAGEFEVTAAADDGATVTVSVEAGTEQVVELRLEGTGSVAGRVLDERGEPVAGAEVQVGTRVGATAFREMGATSDRAGVFEVRGLPAGSGSVEVAADGYARASEDLTVASGETARVEVVLARGGEVRGQVRGLSATELGDCAVRVGSGMTRVAGDGRFRLAGVALGRQVVVAQVGMGQRTRSAAVDVELGRAAEVELDFAGEGSLTGTVRRAGQGVAAVVVTAGLLGADDATTTRSDSDGRYTLTGLAAGEYLVLALDAQGRTLASRSVAVDGAGTLDLEVADGRIEGQVVDRRDQTPVAGVAVTVSGIDDVAVRRSTVSAGAGRFAVDQLPDGGYLVAGAAEDGASDRRTVALRASATAEVRLELEAGNHAELMVTDSNGQLVTNLLGLELAAGHVGEWTAASCRAPGRCRLGPLPRGLVVLHLRSEGAAVVAVNVPGPPVAVQLVPRGQIAVIPPSDAARPWWVRLATADGLPIPVGSYSNPGRGEWLPVAATGLSPSVPAGLVRVGVRSPDGAVAERTVTVVGGATAEVRLGG